MAYSTSPRAQWLLSAAAILLLAFGLRIWNLGDASLWADEAWAAKWVQADTSSYLEDVILRRGVIELPLHTASLRLLPTHNEFLLRFPSVIAGLAAIAVFMRLIKQVYSARTMALFAGLVLATNPLHVWFSRGARPYAYFFTASLCVAFFFSLLLRGNRSRTIWIGFVVSSALAYLTHYYALLLPVVQYLVFGMYLKRYRSMLRPWLVAQITAGLGLLTLWVTQVILDNPTIAGITWIPDPKLVDIPLTAANMLVGYTAGGKAFWIALLGVLGAGIGLALGITQTLKRRDAVNAFWLLLGTLPLIAIFVASKIVHPIYVDRYLSEAQIGLLALMVVGWRWLPRRQWNYLLASIVAFSGVAIVWQTVDSGAYIREDWRAAAAYISSEAEAGDSIAIEERYFLLALSYYLPEDDLPTYTLDELDAENSLVSSRTWVIYRNPLEDIHIQGVMPDFDPYDAELSMTGAWLRENKASVLQRADFNGISVFLVGPAR